MDKRKRLQITFSRQERKQVEGLLSGGVQPVRAVLRALVLQQIDAGRTTVEAGAAVSISAETAWEMGRRYEEGGLEAAIYDARRPSQKPLLDAEQGQRIIAMVCGPPPAGRARWSVQLIAHEAVKRKLVEHVVRSPSVQDTWPGATTSTSAAALPTSSVAWSRKRGGIFPSLQSRARRRSLPIT
jgi:transposase